MMVGEGQSTDLTVEQMVLLKNINIQPLPVRTIETFLFRPHFFEIIQTILEGHGVTVERFEEKCVLMFPEGTSKSELLPRVRDSRYVVRLPDGYFLYETIGATGTLSLVRLNLDGFPKEMQERLQAEQREALS